MGASVLFNNLQNIEAAGSSSGPGSAKLVAAVKVNGWRTRIPGYFAERSSRRIVAVITDDATGLGIPLEQFTEFLLTLYLLGTGTIINGRNKQNILNANGATLVSAGSPLVTTLTYQMDPLDNQVLGAEHVEYHVALLEWKWDGGTKQDRHEVVIPVENMMMVP